MYIRTIELVLVFTKMPIDLNKIETEALENIEAAESSDNLESLRVKYLGRKSEISGYLRTVKDLDVDDRAEAGEEVNRIKKNLKKAFEGKSKELREKEVSEKMTKERTDISAPGKKMEEGSLHPITQALRDVRRIFNSMGFYIVEGPEAETDFYNFDALNIPKEHPSRDLMDTFWIKKEEGMDNYLLRTHTSPMQIRFMEKHNPPFRIVVPGRVFRHEATDATHEIQFYQVEGLMVDKNVSLAHLKGVLTHFLSEFFKKDVEIKFHQSHFPFTEPSVEVFMKLKGKWIEIAGAGMVHPNVFKAVKYNPPGPDDWQGFAFGIGVDRLVMIKHNIDDVRLLYGGDLRFLKQF